MRKRPMAIGAMLFLTGIVFAFFNQAFLLSLLIVISACIIHFCKIKSVKSYVIAIIILILGFARMNTATLHKNSIADKYNGKSITGNFTVTEFSENNNVSAYFTDNGKKVKVYLRIKEPCSALPGDVLRGEVTFSTSSETDRNGSFTRNLASRGIYLYATAEKMLHAGRYEKGLEGRIYSLQQYMENLGKTHFEGDSRALFSAMIYGNKAHLSDELYLALQGSGLNHIAVVSGMHLSVAIAFIMLFVRKIIGKRSVGAIVAISCAVLITLVTGAGASVVRALIMCILFYLARVLHRERDSFSALSCAVFVMTAVNPYMIFNIGFILSVISVLGILLYGERLTLSLSRFVPEKAADILAITLGAQLLVTPVIVYYFAMITPYAPLSNIIAVPLSGIYLIIGILFVLLSPVKPLALILSYVTDLVAKLIEIVISGVGKFQFAILSYRANAWLFIAVWVIFAIKIYRKSSFGNLNNKFSLQTPLSEKNVLK